MNIGVIGLTGAGWDLAIRLHNSGVEILAFDEDANTRREINQRGIKTAPYIDEFAFGLESKRVVWIFQPDETKMNDTLDLLVPHLSVSDIIIVMNPALIEETARRCREVQGLQIDLLDCSFSTSNDPGKQKAFVGGNRFAFNHCEKIIQQIAEVVYCGLCGTGIQRKLASSNDH